MRIIAEDEEDDYDLIEEVFTEEINNEIDSEVNENFLTEEK